MLKDTIRGIFRLSLIKHIACSTIHRMDFAHAGSSDS